MVKIDIISGFLGAGKTTLIKKLLSSALKGQNIVLIENEFGDIGIDGGFLKEAGIRINEMNSGCICCSLVGDFKKALNQVYQEYSPDRIVIEPSGVGKLSDVLNAVMSAELPDCKISSLTAVVDAKKCKMYFKNFGEFYKDQIQQAKCVVLSHTGDIATDKLQYCLDTVKSLNDEAVIVTTPWDDIDGEKIFAAMTNSNSLADELKKLEEEEICPVCGHHHDHEHGEECGCGHHHHDHEHGEECSCGHHHHHADEVFSSWGAETANKYDCDGLKNMLEALDGGEYGIILRAKGIVCGEDGRWLHFDYVPEEVEVRFGGGEVIGRICVIGSNLNKEKLAELFKVNCR